MAAPMAGGISFYKSSCVCLDIRMSGLFLCTRGRKEDAANAACPAHEQGR